MAELVEDWERTRSPGTPFTDAEREQLRVFWESGVSARDTARALKSSIRNVHKYYAILRSGKSIARGARKLPEEPADRAHILVRLLCYANECLAERLDGSKFCAKHSARKPATPSMMARRA